MDDTNPGNWNGTTKLMREQEQKRKKLGYIKDFVRVYLCKQHRRIQQEQMERPYPYDVFCFVFFFFLQISDVSLKVFSLATNRPLCVSSVD